MKKQFVLFVAAAFLSITTLMAQEARQRQTPEEKTKEVMGKLEAWNLTTSVRTQAETIFIDFYKAAQTSAQDARAAGSDRTAMMEKRKALATERDSKLKNILTAEEYSKWISDIEPSLRPQRPQGNATAPAAPQK